IKFNESEYETISFEIEEKISFNKLKDRVYLIEEYFHFNRNMVEIYEDLDRQGNNKSRSVLQKIWKIYKDLKIQNEFSADEIFDECSKEIKKVVMKSTNLKDVEEDSLEMYIDIILVDAFVRCKIFENPEKAKDVITR
ncbi:ABC-three component system protein, partial [Mycoplasma yeatsii]|uniref:ABC-three component system protein n=1 Tax=Mycoplasma yeatsii TaxID=51365 RepID=UPI00056C00DB